MKTEKKQIFIVDDDESVCRALKYLLIAFGYEVETFLSASKYFSAVPNSVPGSLIMDVHMPVMNGWEALKLLRKNGSKRPVIIISADENGSMKEQALKSGAVGYFQKPVKDQELVNLINKTYLKEA